MAFIYVTGYPATHPIVGLEALVSIAKVDTPVSNDTSDSGDGVYHAHTVAKTFDLVFYMANGTSIVWRFTSDALRTTALTAIAAVTTASTAIPIT